MYGSQKGLTWLKEGERERESERARERERERRETDRRENEILGFQELGLLSQV